MIGDIFPFLLVVCVRSFNVEYLLLGFVEYMDYPRSATVIFLTGYHPKPKSVGYLSWAVDEVVEFSPGPL